MPGKNKVLCVYCYIILIVALKIPVCVTPPCWFLKYRDLYVLLTGILPHVPFFSFCPPPHYLACWYYPDSKIFGLNFYRYILFLFLVPPLLNILYQAIWLSLIITSLAASSIPTSLITSFKFFQCWSSLDKHWDFVCLRTFLLHLQIWMTA